MVTWVETHGIEVLVIYYLFAAISGGMPTPASDAGIAYRWIFSSINILNASFARLIATQFSASKVGSALNNPIATEGNQVATVQVQKVEPLSDGAVKVTTTETKEVGGKQ